MNNQEWGHARKLISWGIVGLILLVGVSIVVSVILFVHHSNDTAYPYFPFHFAWFGGIFLIFVIFWMVRWLFWPWRSPYWHRHDNAASILRERYAKGEITKEQFEQMMQHLKQHD